MRVPYLRPTAVLLDFDALARNFALLKARLPPRARILAIVKANGYGHGSLEIAQKCRALGAAGVGVADVTEAVILRRAGYTDTILCLGAITKEGTAEALHSDAVVTLHTLEMLEPLAECVKHSWCPLRVHVKVDTGMNRLGIPENEWEAAAEALAHGRSLAVEGIFTHLAETENPDRKFTDLQLDRFESAVGLFEKRLGRRLVRHAVNSGGLLAHPRGHFDWVRPGIALYGYPPVRPDAATDELKPVLAWTAPIIQIKRLKPGDTVGYNRSYRCDANRTIAVVPVGYGDGYCRDYAGVGVGFRGRRCRIVGSVCMDLLMVDVTECGDVCVGETVYLVDDGSHGGPDVRELASARRTVPYEVLTGISARVARRAAGA